MSVYDRELNWNVSVGLGLMSYAITIAPTGTLWEGVKLFIIVNNC